MCTIQTAALMSYAVSGRNCRTVRPLWSTAYCSSEGASGTRPSPGRLRAGQASLQVMIVAGKESCVWRAGNQACRDRNQLRWAWGRTVCGAAYQSASLRSVGRRCRRDGLVFCVIQRKQPLRVPQSGWRQKPGSSAVKELVSRFDRRRQRRYNGRLWKDCARSWWS